MRASARRQQAQAGSPISVRLIGGPPAQPALFHGLDPRPQILTGFTEQSRRRFAERDPQSWGGSLVVLVWLAAPEPRMRMRRHRSVRALAMD